MDEQQTFYVKQPQPQTIPFVFNSPHSGNSYSQAFLKQSAVPLEQLRDQEDLSVDEMFALVSDVGAPMMAALFPRCFVDLNREPYELDPDMFEGALPPYVNTRTAHALNGIGTIARLCANGQEIYDHKLHWADAFERIQNFYMPYHAQLQKLLDDTYQKFNFAVLLDCHSMPADNAQADIVIGNRFGQSAHHALSDYIGQLLQKLGYHIIYNKPYAGGSITEYYGKPKQNRHALQIEINRGIYMNEKNLTLNKGFESLRKDMGLFAKQLYQFDFETIRKISCHH